MTDLTRAQVPSHWNTRLVRNHDMVHRRACYRVSGVPVNPWLWAEGKTDQEISAASRNGIKFCRSCDPLSARLPALSVGKDET